MRRTVNAGDNEPEKAEFDRPSKKEHLFQVTDVFTNQDEMGQKLKLDDSTISIKLEVVGGDEEGRTLLNRLNLDEKSKEFWATKLFLKAIGELYKGDNLEIDTDRFIGRQFYADVVHNGKYANINGYNFEKKIEQQYKAPVSDASVKEVPKNIQW